MLICKLTEAQFIGAPRSRVKSLTYVSQARATSMASNGGNSHCLSAAAQQSILILTRMDLKLSKIMKALLKVCNESKIPMIMNKRLPMSLKTNTNPRKSKFKITSPQKLFHNNRIKPQVQT